MSRDEDDDAHVRIRERVLSLSTVLLALRFYELACDQAKQAEGALCDAHERADAARDVLLDADPNDVVALRLSRHAFNAATHAVVRLGIQAGQSLDFLIRTSATLDDALRLYSFGRN
jgi:hypothetical protein